MPIRPEDFDASPTWPVSDHPRAGTTSDAVDRQDTAGTTTSTTSPDGKEVVPPPPLWRVLAPYIAVAVIISGLLWLYSFKSVNGWLHAPGSKPTIQEAPRADQKPGQAPQTPIASQPQPASPSPQDKSDTPETEEKNEPPTTSSAPGGRTRATNPNKPKAQENNQPSTDETETQKPATDQGVVPIPAPVKPAVSPPTTATEEPQHPNPEIRTSPINVPPAPTGHDSDLSRSMVPQVVNQTTEVAPVKFTGPSSGTLLWQGEVQGAALVVIENGLTNVGTISGTPLPGVMCMVQISDQKHFSIAVAPAPSNEWKKVVLNVRGTGVMKVKLSWVIP
jgi:hypothetical protein